MALAHSCAVCGSSLTRIRAVRDTRYDLPLVTCPGCSTTWVRRRHPLSEAGRSALRLGGALGALAVQLALLAGLSLGMIAAVMALPPPPGLARRLAETPWTTGVWVIILPVLGGVWLTAGLAHWRRWAAWTAWGLLLAAWLALDSAVAAGTDPAAGAAAAVTGWLDRLGTLAIALVVATAGIPLGIGLRRVGARRVVAARRRRRRRLRAGRRGP